MKNSSVSVYQIFKFEGYLRKKILMLHIYTIPPLNKLFYKCMIIGKGIQALTICMHILPKKKKKLHLYVLYKMHAYVQTWFYSNNINVLQKSSQLSFIICNAIPIVQKALFIISLSGIRCKSYLQKREVPIG